MLLLAVVVSATLSRALPWSIPRPLVQIAVGAAISFLTDQSVPLNPELFFLVFLPPLLFLDGWRIPREELLRDSQVVLELALGLVVFTVVGMGFFINWMIPTMPLPVAFALAAVLSPTDAIAVSAIAQRVPIPKRMMHILEGESLLNDASGLVGLRFAIAAALTGTFSLYDASLTFLWVALGGLAVGVGVTWGVAQLKDRISRRLGEDSGSQILISLLIPFGSYLLAESLHCSGILAAVAAGITMSVVETSGRALAITRIRRNTVWDTIQFAANGIIFVLLGEQLPDLLVRAAQTVQLTGHRDPWWLAVYVVAINIGLAVLRFVWVWVSFKFTLFRAGDGASPNWRIIAAMSLAGVRGAITLAGILTLPFVMNDGTPFPARDLAIFLAMGVIIGSLVAASIGLPLLLKGLQMPPEASGAAAEDAARLAAAQAALAAIERQQHALVEGRKGDVERYLDVASTVMEGYRRRIAGYALSAEAAAQSEENSRVEQELRLAALRAERTEIFRLVRSRKLGSETARKLIRELDLSEVRYSAPR